jgi:hypothetical protein
VFMFGEPNGRQAHVLIPAPAIDAAHVGDIVEVTGPVRRYSAREPANFLHARAGSRECSRTGG